MVSRMTVTQKHQSCYLLSKMKVIHLWSGASELPFGLKDDSSTEASELLFALEDEGDTLVVGSIRVVIWSRI